MWVANVAGVLATTPEATRPQLAAYPNPSPDGRYTLTLPAGASELRVLDGLGRVVLTTACAGHATCPLDVQA